MNLSSLAIWKQEPIGGSYSTDLVTPRSSNVQRIYLEHTGWGLTELQIKNEDNLSNYAGAVLSLKGSGPDYTNNMFFAKLGDNYYVPSWAGKGVVSTDQPLVIASVQSNDPAHPNNNPYIMFQTGGYYTSPVDRMILDSNGNLGINDFSPAERLTVGGNIRLSDSGDARIYSSGTDLRVGTTTRNLFMYSLNRSKVYLAVDPSGNRQGLVYVGTLTDPTSYSYNPNKLFTVVADGNRIAPMAVVRYSNNNSGPVALYYKARGTQSSPSIVADNDVLGGYNSLAYTGTGGLGWQLVAQLRHRVHQVNGTTVVPYLEFKHRQPDGSYKDVARMLYDGRFGIGNITPEATLDLTPITSDYVALNIRSENAHAGLLRFMEGDGGSDYVTLQAAHNMSTPYSLILPATLGSTYEVMYHAGGGQLAWDTVGHLLGVDVPAHSVLYSDGTQIAGDPNNFYWDWTNKHLGIGNSSPQAPLEIDRDGGPALIVRTTSSTGYASLIVAAPSLPSTNATRVQITHGGIYGTWYNSIYWSLNRDNWGSGTPGLKLYNRAGIWYKLGAGGGSVPQYSLVLTNNSQHRVVIKNTGEVGVATYNPVATFQVGEAGDGTYALANAWNTFSDARFKEEVREIDDALGKIMKLSGVYYRWKIGKDKKRQIGFIAQDVREIVPELVSSTPEGYLTIDYSKFTPLLVNAIHELDRKTESAGKDQEVRRIIYGDQSTTGLLQVTKWTKSVFNFLTDVVFKAKATFEGAVTFAKQVVFNDRVEFADKDMGGYAVIRKGDDAVSISFDKPFAETPVVVVSSFQQVNYEVVDESAKGFTIKLAAAATEDLKFSWIALNIKDAKTVYSSSSSPAPAPTKPITPKPTVSVTPTNTPAPTRIAPKPSPTPLPKATISPSSTPVPSPTAAGTVTPTPTAKPLPTISVVPKI